MTAAAPSLSAGPKTSRGWTSELVRVPREIPHNTERRGYWYEKHARNALRDDRVEAELREAGWRVLIIWECETTPREKLRATLAEFFGVARPPPRRRRYR